MKIRTIVTSMTVCASPAWAAAPLMDVAPLVSLIQVFTLIIMALLVVKAILTSKTFKGWLGEFTVRQLTALNLDADTYHQLHDVTLPTEDGTTQIDHIIVSKFGIFVIETKHMSGWIFGRASDPKWTQSFRNHKNSFQNPLRQNYKHTKELNAHLGVGEHKIFSVVVFTGDAEFKTEMPENVMHGRRLVRYIRSKDTVLLSESDLQKVLLKINGSMLERSAETKRQHILNLSKKHRTNEPDWQTDDPVPKLKIAVIVLAAIGALSLMNKATRPVVTQPPVAPPAITTTQPQTSLPLQSAVRIEAPKPRKAARSPEHGFLTLSAKQDTYVTFYDANNAEVVRMELKKGQSEEVELKKGYYTAETLQAGKRVVSTVSFIGNTGVLEF